MILGMAMAFVGGGGIPIAWAARVSAHPASQYWGPVVHRLPGHAANQIALTFDDGPDGEYTPRILDRLAEHQMIATFFLIGRNVRRFPEVVRRIAKDGHVIGNHTWDHDHHAYLRGQDYWNMQINQTDRAISEITGKRPTLFRPPMGLRNRHTMRAAAGRGQRVITWSRRGMDGVRTTAEKITGRLADRTIGGEIVVLHDGVEPNSRRNQDATCAAIDPILRRWRERGLSPVPLDAWLDPPAATRQTSPP